MDIKTSLTAKKYDLPVWAWAIVIAVVLFFGYRYLKNRQSGGGGSTGLSSPATADNSSGANDSGAGAGAPPSDLLPPSDPFNSAGSVPPDWYTSPPPWWNDGSLPPQTPGDTTQPPPTTPTPPTTPPGNTQIKKAVKAFGTPKGGVPGITSTASGGTKASLAGHGGGAYPVTALAKIPGFAVAAAKSIPLDPAIRTAVVAKRNDAKVTAKKPPVSHQAR